MALDDQGNPIPGTIDSLSFALGGAPPPEWGYDFGAPLQVAAPEYPPPGVLAPPMLPPAPPPPPPPPPPTDAAAGTGRKGGSADHTEHLGPSLSQGGEEVPLGVVPPAAAAAGVELTPPGLPPEPGSELAAPPPLEQAPAAAAPPQLENRQYNPFEADAISGGTAPTDARAPSMPPEYLSGFEKDVAQVTGATPDQLGSLNDEQLGVAIANLPPAEQAVIKQRHDAALANFVAGRQLEESHTYLAAMQAANARAMQRSAAVDAESKRLADINPSGWMDSRTGGQKLAAAIAVIAGGLAAPQMGGHNVGLEMIQQAARDNVDAQKANLAKNQTRLAGERGSIHDELDRSAVMQQATYETAIRGLQAEAQKYDPRGSTAMGIAGTIGQVRALQAASAQQQHQQRLKDEAEQAKIELDKANTAKAQAEAAKLRGALGAGGGSDISSTNPKYTTPTGIFNPFDSTQPLFGRRPLGKKGGGDEKEFERVDAQVGTYAHVQRYWDKLNKLGAQIGYAKSGPEMVWAKRRGTLEKEYDQAHEALVVYLTKELGDKLTAGQLEAQSKRIPERADVFTAADPARLIHDAQDDADRDFVIEMNKVGIDAGSVVQRAQKMRADAPKPAITDDVAAAQEALASAPPDSPQARDAQAELDAANDRRAQHIDEKQQNKAAVGLETGIAKTGAVADTLDTEGLPTKAQALVLSRNEAIERQQAELAKLTELQKTKLKPTGQVGVDNEAAGELQAKIEHQAGAARDAERAVSLATNQTLRYVLENLDDLDDSKRQQIEDAANKLDLPTIPAMRKFALVRAATGDDANPRFRLELLRILGAQVPDANTLDAKVAK